MQMRWLCLCLLCVSAAACGDDSGPGSISASDAGPGRTLAARECVDGDEDGFGEYCDAGRDCDDGDPAITDECLVCAVPTHEGCPCEPMTRPLFCIPDIIEAAGGYYECEEGSRYCRDGAWSACEAVADYVFVPTGQ